MTDAGRPHSLLDAPTQAALPLGLGGNIEPAASVEVAARLPVFTGAAVFSRDPERYRLFCELFFTAGLGQMEVCRVLGMSPQTGAAIIAREQSGMTAQQLRDMQAARARTVVTATLSAIQERLSDPEALKEIPLHHLAQTLQRAHEVGAMLAGDATSRVERVDSSRPSRDAAADYLDSIPAADVREHSPTQSIPTGKIGEARTDGSEGDQDTDTGERDASGRPGVADRDGPDTGGRDLQSRTKYGAKDCNATDKAETDGASYADGYAGTAGAAAAEVVDGEGARP